MVCENFVILQTAMYVKVALTKTKRLTEALLRITMQL
jgi:hypothetical protein